VGAAEQTAAPNTCRITGKVTSGARPLPGVVVLVRDGDRLAAATSTEIDGSYSTRVAALTSYQLTAELTGFAPMRRDLVVQGAPCDAAVDLELTLASRVAAAAVPPAAAASATEPPAANAPGRGAGPGSAPRFETVDVQTDATGAAALQVSPPDLEAAAAAMNRLLPPGFSTEGPTDAVALSGNTASIDRGMMNERLGAIGRGEIDPVTGQPMPGFGPDDQTLGPGGRGGRGQGGPGGRGGRGGGRGAGDFALGGRGRGQRLYTFNSNYALGGSALNATPYQLRPDNPVQESPYTQNTFGFTVGGPVILPGVYNGTRRTNFNASYTGSRNSNFFEQYATVPGAAIRSGDFSALPAPVIDPQTGQPFPGNQIPAGRIDASSLALLHFLPEPNLPGDSRNLYYSTNVSSVSDNLTVRVNHSFTPNAGGGRGGRGGGGGRLGGPGGRGGRSGTSVNLNASIQYRRNDSERANVFPLLSGQSKGSSLSLPVGLNIQRNRNNHAINVNLTRSNSETTNLYAYVEDVAGNAGIQGVSTDPFDWGVPALNFATFSDLRDVTPSRRTDSRFTLAYTWTRPQGSHTLRIGGDFRKDRSENRTDTSARGDFLFTGLYSAGSVTVPPGGLDFADFLLGLSQQASINYGPGNVILRGKSLSAFVQDDWRMRGNLTLSLGLRYELIWPFVEENGHMVTLDVNDDFTAAVPVISGESGPFSGSLPGALVRTDANNLAPRVGAAWRIRPGTILRGGYGVAYNSGSYSSIARQLTAQPPFATANTSVGLPDSPLPISDAFAATSPTTTTNNYGIAPDYALGAVQTWNTDFSQALGQAWEVGGGYTGTKGTSLDMVRAPNRGPNGGVVIPDVQAFTWQTSEARSQLHALTARLQRRSVGGIGGGVSYTFAKSRDNASTLGGGRTTVAQNDKDLEAEWGLSSFDRRHQLSANLNVELPFGPNRRWLADGGFWALVLQNWRVNLDFTVQSGTPYTPTVSGSVVDAASGVNGTLRANYTGEPIALPDPSIDLFFNTAAFSVPPVGSFGTAGRNIIIGPGSRLLNASFSRDIPLGGFRSLTFEVRANNLLNLVNYSGLNTTANSPAFGQITSVRPMRSVTLNFRVRF